VLCASDPTSKRQFEAIYDIVIIQHVGVIYDGAGLLIHRQCSITFAGAFFGHDFFKDDCVSVMCDYVLKE
jgi:hypothetical protein